MNIVNYFMNKLFPVDKYVFVNLQYFIYKKKQLIKPQNLHKCSIYSSYSVERIYHGTQAVPQV